MEATVLYPIPIMLSGELLPAFCAGSPDGADRVESGATRLYLVQADSGGGQGSELRLYKHGVLAEVVKGPAGCWAVAHCDDPAFILDLTACAVVRDSRFQAAWDLYLRSAKNSAAEVFLGTAKKYSPMRIMNSPQFVLRPAAAVTIAGLICLAIISCIVYLGWGLLAWILGWKDPPIVIAVLWGIGLFGGMIVGSLSWCYRHKYPRWGRCPCGLR